MPPPRAALHMLASLFEVLWRRLTGRPRRAGWPFFFEVLVGGLRRNFLWGHGRPIEEVRAFNTAVARMQPLPPGVTRERTSAGGVAVERFRPSDAEPVATLVYLHGGSHVTGSPTTHADYIARLALAGPFEAVAVDFRLAPEHEVGDAVEDALAVHRALLEEPDARPVVWAGDSSGGGLVYLSLIAARDQGLTLPVAVAALSPWVDLRCDAPSYVENEPYDWGTAEVLKAQGELAARGQPLDDPALSPAFAPLADLPPALIHVGDAELVRDSAVAFAETLREEGNEVELKVWPDMVHNFHLFGGFHPLADEGTEELAEFLREHAAS